MSDPDQHLQQEPALREQLRAELVKLLTKSRRLREQSEAAQNRCQRASVRFSVKTISQPDPPAEYADDGPSS